MHFSTSNTISAISARPPGSSSKCKTILLFLTSLTFTGDLEDVEKVESVETSEQVLGDERLDW